MRRLGGLKGRREMVTVFNKETDNTHNWLPITTNYLETQQTKYLYLPLSLSLPPSLPPSHYYILIKRIYIYIHVHVS